MRTVALAEAFALLTVACTRAQPDTGAEAEPAASLPAAIEAEPAGVFAGPHPGLKGPLAGVRFGMTRAQLQAVEVPWVDAPGLVASGPAYVPTWAPCHGEPRMTSVRIDVPDDGVVAQLQRAWGSPQTEHDSRCWFDDALGIRACIGRGLSFGRPHHVTVELEPFVTAPALAAGTGRDFAIARGPLVGAPFASVRAAFEDACIGSLWKDDPVHPKIVLPPTRWGFETALVLELDEGTVARAMLFVALRDDERAALTDALLARFGEAPSHLLEEPSGPKTATTWPGDPEIRLVLGPSIARVLIGPWGDRWSIEPPPRPSPAPTP